MGRPRKSIAERLEQKTDRSGGPDACWPWLGGKDQGGYGRMSVPGDGAHVNRAAHRVALQEATGRTGEGEWALHSCDNPPCCNPAHLRWGSPRQNMADSLERDRRPVLTRDQTAAVREARASGLTMRQVAERFGISTSQVHRLVSR